MSDQIQQGRGKASPSLACSVSFGATRIIEEPLLTIEVQSVLSDREQAGFDWYYRAEGLEFAAALLYRRLLLPTHEQLLARWESGKVRRWRHGKEIDPQNDLGMARRPNNGGQHAASTDPKS